MFFFSISFPFDNVSWRQKLKTPFWNQKDPKCTLYILEILYIHISKIWFVGLKMFHSKSKLVSSKLIVPLLFLAAKHHNHLPSSNSFHWSGLGIDTLCNTIRLHTLHLTLSLRRCEIATSQPWSSNIAYVTLTNKSIYIY